MLFVFSMLVSFVFSNQADFGVEGDSLVFKISPVLREDITEGSKFVFVVHRLSSRLQTKFSRNKADMQKS